MNVPENKQVVFEEWQYMYAALIEKTKKIKKIDFDSPAAKLFKEGWDTGRRCMSNERMGV